MLRALPLPGRQLGKIVMEDVPPFESLRAMVQISNVRGTLMVSASYDEFIALLRRLLIAVDVDEAWYLEQNPDVAAAVSSGAVPSARHHFLLDGYQEGRLPFPIIADAAWYLEQNPGVVDHIRTGRLGSAQQHYEADGYREGRLPFAL